MNNDIKEILDELQRKNDRYNYSLKEDISFSDEDHKSHLLLDYITNLEQELETINKLNQQNLKYKQYYKSRIDKAIELVKSLIMFWKKYSPDNTMEIRQFERILSVLGGDE